ncbi:hypothetical protein BD779DRAFT_1611355 [Infundibulicybe gibba]|nr:hypothetical protein BD779DRAFT_1611355 [Infundibulicybe gibba]
MPDLSQANVALLRSATAGFDHLFSNDIVSARTHFAGKEDPFHLMGLGVCAFLEAALGMEAGLMVEATRCLKLSEEGTRRQIKAAAARGTGGKYPPGLEWEIVNADAVVLLGFTQALGESYMGYLQCIAHSKFTKYVYKTVFPNGLDGYHTPSAGTPALSRNSSFFGRWTGAATLAPPSPGLQATFPDGPVEELIVSGTAFGGFLFIFLLSLNGFLGFKHDRKLALRALGVAAARQDVHSIFAGLVLMTYHGVVLLMSGYQADEAHIIRQYKAIVDKIEARYPTGALWILNRAKILRMSYDAEGAIRTLQEGLKPERPHSFAQADTLLVFELAWTLLAQRRYQEAAEMFIKITEINSWSHGTYYFIAAGCHVSLGDRTRARELFDAIPGLIDKRKISGKDLPTEVLIKKKLEFYRAKQKRSAAPDAHFVDCIQISPADVWNTHSRVSTSIAEAHIAEWSALAPGVSPTSPSTPSSSSASPTSPAYTLDTPDELALRALLLGVAHRTAGHWDTARAFLGDALARQGIRVSTWIPGVAGFEMAVLELKECEGRERETQEKAEGGIEVKVDGERNGNREAWVRALQKASALLDQAMRTTTGTTDLSSRLDSRVSMLRDEIALKGEIVGA